MPIFEFLCSDCGKVTEEIYKSENDRPESCPFCGGKNVEKLVSASAFHLKGSGWYKSDYGSKNTPVSKKSSENSASKTETKTDSKEAPKSLKTAGGCGGGCSCH